jgi:hypothetical protein
LGGITTDKTRPLPNIKQCLDEKNALMGIKTIIQEHLEKKRYIPCTSPAKHPSITLKGNKWKRMKICTRTLSHK